MQDQVQAPQAQAMTTRPHLRVSQQTVEKALPMASTKDLLM